MGSIFVPEEETCFYLFEAGSADAVRQATARLGFQYERVVEVVAGCPMPRSAVGGAQPLDIQPLDTQALDTQALDTQGLDLRSEPL